MAPRKFETRIERQYAERRGRLNTGRMPGIPKPRAEMRKLNFALQDRGAAIGVTQGGSAARKNVGAVSAATDGMTTLSTGEDNGNSNAGSDGADSGGSVAGR